MQKIKMRKLSWANEKKHAAVYRLPRLRSILKHKSILNNVRQKLFIQSTKFEHKTFMYYVNVCCTEQFKQFKTS